MTRSNTDPSPVVPSDAGYGSFVVCPSCSRQSDVWAELCACGAELLPDDRKVKLAKSGGSAFARMTRRCQSLEAQRSVAALEQAVRDLAALRVTDLGKKQAGEGYTPGIVRLLVTLGRIDEACDEAEGLPSRGGAGMPSTIAIEALARECLSRKDPRAEHWLRLVLERTSKGREHLEFQGALAGLFAETGRQPEALEAFESAAAELDALRKKTSKSALANLAGDGDSFAVGAWSQATNTLDTLRMPIVNASAASAVAEGQAGMANVQRLEQTGDIAAARDAASAAGLQLSGVAKRLKHLAAGLSRAEGKTAMDPVESMERSLEAEAKRLKKLAKR